MYRRFTLEQIKQEIIKHHHDNVVIVDETYVGFCKKATFIDRDYGEWKTTVRLVVAGCEHPKRARQKTINSIRLTVDDVCCRVKQQWGGVAELDRSTYIDRTTPARFIDRDYGEWWARPLHVLKGTGRHPKRARANSIASRKLPINIVLKRIYEKHDDQVQLCVETYTNSFNKARFIDRDYGEWWARPLIVMKGGSHPYRRLQKAIKSMRSFSPVLHWKTGEVCYSASGFEHAVLIWLNQNQYDFDWQVPIKTTMLSPTLKMPVVYNVDCLIKSGPFVNTYVEIKGTWTRRANNDGGKAKWERFHENYPNSQLWMRKDLERLGIIDAHRTYLEKARTNE